MVVDHELRAKHKGLLDETGDLLHELIMRHNAALNRSITGSMTWEEIDEMTKLKGILEQARSVR